jgi:methionyl-tRNA formyltransferase
MRLAFMGSPDFAVPALRALHQAGHEIVAAYCQPPRPAGRGHAIRPCAVHRVADALAIPVRTPARLRSDTAEHDAFRTLNLDAAVVAAYGLILPQAMLDAPRQGCLNIHASLLPRWRGAAPIQAAVLAGDSESGITIMRMTAGLDTGPMLLREAVPITTSTTTAALHDQLAEIGARLILEALSANPTPVPQDEAAATYAPKLARDDGRIDWAQPATLIDRRIRAFDPWPGTFTTLAGTVLKILGARVIDASLIDASLIDATGQPGTVLDSALTIACGTAALRPLRVQLSGRAPMETEAFLRGHPVAPGTVLGS